MSDFPACAVAGHEKPNGRRFCRLKSPPRLASLLTCQQCPHAGCTEPPAGYTPPGDPLACIHRGEQVSTVGCQSCAGTVDVAVFACKLHEQCTLTTPADDSTPVCFGCKVRAPHETPHPV